MQYVHFEAQHESGARRQGGFLSGQQAADHISAAVSHLASGSDSHTGAGAAGTMGERSGAGLGGMAGIFEGHELQDLPSEYAIAPLMPLSSVADFRAVATPIGECRLEIQTDRQAGRHPSESITLPQYVLVV